MKVLKRTINWHGKYGVKSFKKLQPSYIRTLQGYTKWTRTKFLTRAKVKDDRFKRNNPENLRFRVFKSTVLKGKNVSPELEIKFRKAFNKGIKAVLDHNHMNAKMIYDLMILQHELKGISK